MRSIFLLSILSSCALSRTPCGLPLDVMFVQDTTASFVEDIPNISKQLANITEYIDKLYPGSRFGVAEFRDKPYFPLGYNDDYCYRLNRGGQLTSNLRLFHDAYARLVVNGGGDGPEAQFQAIINVALDQQVGWRDLYADPTATHPTTAGRVAILVTDARPHLPGDVAKFTDIKDLPPNSGIISTDDITFECTSQQYPSPDQMAAVLEAQKIHLIILTPNEKQVPPAWVWVNDVLLMQDPGYYQFTKNDSSDIATALEKAIQTVALDIPCEIESSTTEEVTTTAVVTTQDPTGTASPDCSKCPCNDNGLPCDKCDAACEGAVYIRLAKKPQHLQVVVDNE